MRRAKPLTPEVPPPKSPPEVGRMLKLLKGEMSRVELMSALGLRDEKISARITNKRCWLGVCWR
jgi:hypothetical protein